MVLGTFTGIIKGYHLLSEPEYHRQRFSPLGADSEIVNKYYTHVGDEAQRQAIAAISGDIGSKSVQQRINEALGLICTSSEPSDAILEKVKIILAKSYIPPPHCVFLSRSIQRLLRAQRRFTILVS